MYAEKFDFENGLVLKSNLVKLKESLHQHETAINDPALTSLEIFAKLPAERQVMILSNISTSVRILEQQLDPEIFKTHHEREVARLKMALKAFNLKVGSDEVYKVISTDDVIEIYDINGVQIYRNMRFFKMCSYNLLDLAVNPWDKLYDKPSHVLEQTMQVVQRLFSDSGRPVPYGFDSFLQKEKFEYAETLKTVKVTPRYMVPLYNAITGEPGGAFTSNTGEIIAEGLQSSRFSTI